MIKTILAPSFGTERDIATYAAALAVARPFGAHIDVLHVRLDATNVALAMATDAGSGALTAGLIDRLEDDSRQSEAAAQAIFIRFCRDAGLAVTDASCGGRAAAPSAAWHVETGEEPRWMTSYGLAADLVVAPRDKGDEAPARSVLEAVLRETGRPLLIPAAAAMPASFDRVAIAWKATPQAVRAVVAAMPFLARAKQIAVLTVQEGAEEPDDGVDRLLRNLARHGFAATAEQLAASSDGAAAALLDGAASRADLLVMGGYGHSPVREWVFGGFTQQALSDAPLPVLIAH